MRAQNTPRGVKLAVLAAVPVMAAAMAGCGADDTAASGTEETGELTIYSGRDEELVQPIIDRLEEETGLRVEVRYAGSAELAALLLEEGDRTEADLFFSQDAGALGALVQEGMFSELPTEITELVPDGYKADDGTWVGVSGRSRVIAYDPRQVDTPPDSVLELTDEEWNGRVGIAPGNASFQSFVTALRVIEGEDVARTWLEDLAANEVQSYDGNSDMLDALDTGDIAISLNNHYYWYELVKESGAENVESQLHYLPDGDAGALVNVAGAGVLAASDNTEGAQEALGFLLGAEAQEYFTEETSEYPLVEGVETMEELPELGSLSQPEVNLSDLHSLAETTAMLEEVGLV